VNTKKKTQEGTVVQSRRARFDYEIADTLECGMVLAGTEVKSLRNGGGVLTDAYGEIRKDQVWLVGMKIQPYSHGNIQNHPSDRTRKLLLNRSEIERLADEVKQGLQLVPMRVYFKDGLAKLELGIGRPKKQYDKRAAIKERENKEEVRRASSQRGRHHHE